VVPTVKLFKDGKCINEFQGNIDDNDLKSFISIAVESWILP